MKIATKCTFKIHRITEHVAIKLYTADSTIEFSEPRNDICGTHHDLMQVLSAVFAEGFALACIPQEVG